MDVEYTKTRQKTTFSVQSESYSGPLDLLIDLIEKRKFLVNDISLTSVTDDYMIYVSQLENNPLKDTADFIVLASTLLLLKSKSLLPVLEFTEDEEESIETLERRLKYYQIFRNAGKALQSNFGNNISYEKQFVASKKPLFITDKYANLNTLSESIASVLTNLPKKIERPKVCVQKIVSLNTMIDRLKNKIENQFQFNFNDFTKNEQERSSIIVGFLAVLELVKQGNLLVKQAAHFHEIEIESNQRSAPRYQ